MRRFLVDRIDEEKGFCVLSRPETRHLTRVLRMGPGDRLVLLDRAGRRFEAALHSEGPQGLRLELLRSLPAPSPSPVHITLCQALLKSKAMDFVMQKATELGVDRIVPVITERSVPRVRERDEQKKVRRWQEIAAGAVKQSDAARLPLIEAPSSLEALLERQGPSPDTLKIFLWERETEGSVKALFRSEAPRPRIVGLVGPEGGFTQEEAARARASGFSPVSLGRRILRAETAATVLVALAQYEWGDLERAEEEGRGTRAPGERV